MGNRRGQLRNHDHAAITGAYPGQRAHRQRHALQRLTQNAWRNRSEHPDAVPSRSQIWPGTSLRPQPSAFEKRQTRPKGGATYSVDFQVDGQDDYVTANSELPTFTDGAHFTTGSNVEFDNTFTSE